MVPRRLGTTLAFFLVLVLGCEETKTVNNVTLPTEPAQVAILTDGRVIGGRREIKCEDDSETIPEGRIAAVRWAVRAPAGDTVDSANIASKGELTFTGLAPGRYSVE